MGIYQSILTLERKWKEGVTLILSRADGSCL